MKKRIIIATLCLILMSVSYVLADNHGGAKAEKPGRLDAALTTLEATVEAIDLEKRQVVLKGPQGNTVMINVDEDVQNLPQVEVGDTVTVEYLESVAIQVVSAEEIEAGAATAAAVAKAKPGEKPAGLAVEQTTVVATIEAIDLDNELVTLKNAQGETKTVRPQEPENLKKVEVGDKVIFTFTEAVGISVMKK